MQSENFFNEINDFKGIVDTILLNKDIVDDKQVEKFLKDMEKCRYNLFELVELNNIYDDNNIDFVNKKYKTELKDNVLKITIPEVIPKYKNINNYAYKNIMLNVAESVKDYSGLFKDKLTLIVIIVHEKQLNFDIDNKFVKPIIDGLVLKNVIYDDNINNMFYMAIGKNDTKKPYTEVYVLDGNNMKNWVENLQKM